jgi:hypothetical protein
VTNFASLSAQLNAVSLRLGDDIVYTPSGQGALSLKVFVDSGEDRIESFGRTRVEAMGPEVHIRVLDLPSEPTPQDRLLIPGLGTFAPVEFPLDESRQWWIITCNEVVS